MRSNIEQAIMDLMTSKQPITLPTILPVYMRIAGFSGLCEEVVIAFERAMDKHPARPDNIQSPEIERLRNQYWYDKLGGCKNGGGVCHSCPDCGGLRLPGKERVARDNGASKVEDVSPCEPRKGEWTNLAHLQFVVPTHLLSVQPDVGKRNASASRNTTHMHLRQVARGDLDYDGEAHIYGTHFELIVLHMPQQAGTTKGFDVVFTK